MEMQGETCMAMLMGYPLGVAWEGGGVGGSEGGGHGERDEPRGEVIAHADLMGRCGST
jgi:hypothetical protein